MAGGLSFAPDKLMEQFSGKNAPEKKDRRIKGESHARDWAEAIRAGRSPVQTSPMAGRSRRWRYWA